MPKERKWGPATEPAPRLVYVIGEGIGNMIETLPTLVTLERESGFAIDIVIAKASFDIPHALFAGKRVYTLDTFTNEVVREYVGCIMTIWGDIHTPKEHPLRFLPVMNHVGRQQMRLDTSEVQVYLNAARDLGVDEANITYDVRHRVQTIVQKRKRDVVLANGYNYVNTADKWEAKSYAYYTELAKALKAQGLTVASVGAEREYIEMTENLTGLDLLETAGVLKSARVVVSNDSGIYHLAAALQVPTLVIFTFTNVTKNYDPVFHATVKVLRKDMSCYEGCHQHHRWKSCETWECRTLEVDKVLAEVLAITQET